MSKFKEFLKKAGGHVPELLNVVGTLVTGNIGDAIKQTGAILKNESTKTEKGKELYQEFEREKMNFALEKDKIVIQDIADARKNTTDSKQKNVFSNFFLIFVSIYVIWFMYISIMHVSLSPATIDTKKWIESLIVAIMFTMKDYYFGGATKD